ncbi:MAG: YraN family protein, partial [Ignavibacteriales bacterium]|nr:YraN family protein [Ignavibacteriales bacterium]
GDEGESIAVEYLRGQGFSILETKFRYGRAEIDVVGEDRGELVFVEVKARSSLQFGEPEESVTPAKEKRILRAAVGYCVRNRMMDRFYRFDIVSIRFRGRMIILKHLRNAF